jgi:hypothetical protein
MHIPRLHRSIVALAAAVSLLLLPVGCGRKAPPKDIAASDIPAESQSLFEKASPELKALAAKAGAAIQASDWPTAWALFQAMAERNDLTPEQQQLVASSIMSLGAEMQKASERGDERARELRQIHSSSK